MVSWWIGSHYNYQVSTGKMGKYFKKFLPESYYEMYKETYSDSDYEHFWNSIFITCELFRSLAKETAEHLGYTYLIDDDKKMMEYLQHIRKLPANAHCIYPALTGSKTPTSRNE